MISKLTSRRFSERLFLKYIWVLVAVCAVLFANVGFEFWVFYKERMTSVLRIEQEEAEKAAVKIYELLNQIEVQLGWTTRRPWTAPESDRQRLELWRLLLRQVPAITDAALLDSAGREELGVSRIGLDRIGSGVDLSKEHKFVRAVTLGSYHGPVYFRAESEPYMTIALASTGAKPTVSVAEVNLKFMWDTISQIKVGENGYAYVVDTQGRLIAHPDISLVLRDTDLSNLVQVQAARAARAGGTVESAAEFASDIHGRNVLYAYAPIGTIGWVVFVELPLAEAFAPVYHSIVRAILLLAGGAAVALLMGLFLARRIVRPIERLQEFAATVRSTNNYSLRLNYTSRDEIGALSAEFNNMLSEFVAFRDREIAHQAELARAERLAAIGEITSSIAHDFANLLTPILGNLDLVEKQLNNSRSLARIKAAIAAAKHGEALVQSLLSFARQEPLLLTFVDVNSTIVHMKDLLSQTLGSSDRLTVDLAPGAWSARVDASGVNTAILNLVINARDAITGGGAVRVSTANAVLRGQVNGLAGDFVAIAVSDTGCGMSAEVRERAFEPLFTTKAPGKGTGLGLSSVYGFAKRCGGTVTIDSEVGKGTTVTLYLPRVESAATVRQD